MKFKILFVVDYYYIYFNNEEKLRYASDILLRTRCNLIFRMVNSIISKQKVILRTFMNFFLKHTYFNELRRMVKKICVNHYFECNIFPKFEILRLYACAAEHCTLLPRASPITNFDFFYV